MFAKKPWCEDKDEETLEQMVKEEMATYDENKDGTISFDEMCNVAAALMAECGVLSPL